MTYQDTWLKGSCEARGDRECADRYALIRAFCAQYRRPFTVLDLGANLCYFGVRLTEDFPDCTVCAIESDSAAEALDVLRRNEARRVILLRRHVSLEDLERLGECEHFDVVLAMSVIHHFGDSCARRLQALRNLGDNVVIELAYEDAACGGTAKAFSLPDEAVLLGRGKSHLDDGYRGIWALEGMKTSIRKAYLESPREDLAMTIYSDFAGKRVHFYSKPEARDWMRGINLQTYLKFGGCWPERAEIARQLESHKAAILAEGHGDINPWNVILQGDDVRMVDVHGPMEVVFPDAEYWDKLMLGLAAQEGGD